MQRVCIVGFAAVCGLAISARAAAQTPADYSPPPPGKVRIVRDRFGVPHIIAAGSRELNFGAGFAQATDQLENLATNVLRGQGRAAEREGIPQVIYDHLIRLLDIPALARAGVEHLESDTLRDLQAFCDGVNAYLALHRDEVAVWITPIEPAQIVAFALYVDLLFCVRDCRDDLERAGVRLASLDRLPRDSDSLWGSNQFALRPERSGTGSALLSMDPHLPLSGFFRWYEMHLVGPEFNVMGACFFGLPYVSMGRTDRSAWCMTVNAPDLGDVFVFDINPDDPTQYKDVDGWKTFDTHTEEYRVRSPVGETVTNLPCKRTSAGPVVVERDGKAYVFALPLPEAGGRMHQLAHMAQARNVREFQDALRPLGLSMFNIVYADTSGDIFYVSNGRVPKRDTRIDSRDLRPGDAPWARWQGMHSFDELPQVLNPPANYLLNANSGPQNVTPEGGPDLSTFPPYMNRQQANSRSRRLSELLAADSSVDWDELATYATDTQIEAGVQYVPRLVAALRGQAERQAGARDELSAIAGVLEAWDRRTDLDSRGAVLFWHLANDPQTAKLLADETAGADAELAATALKVAKDVIKTFGGLDVAWGEFSRIRRGEIEMGISGCGIPKAKPKGALIGAALRPTTGAVRDGHQWCDTGSSYGMLVDFSGKTRAISCLPFGISDHAESPHFADQLPLYVTRKFKPAWFWPDEIAANTESEETLDVPAARP